jgi:hypothetical protein
MEYYINDLQIYLKALCVAHTDLLHDDATNVSFVRFQSDDDIQQAANQGAANLVILARYYGRAAGETADDMNMKQFVQLRFACAAINDAVLNYGDVITAATDKAFTIMMDFVARMGKAQRDDNCGPLRGLELPSASWSEIPDQPYLVQHYGWDLTLPFTSTFPPLNVAKWNDLP